MIGIMDRDRRSKPAPDEPATPPGRPAPCRACGTVRDDHVPTPIATTPDRSIELTCVDPAMCRRRAVAAGVYGIHIR